MLEDSGGYISPVGSRKTSVSLARNCRSCSLVRGIPRHCTGVCHHCGAVSHGRVPCHSWFPQHPTAVAQLPTICCTKWLLKNAWIDWRVVPSQMKGCHLTGIVGPSRPRKESPEDFAQPDPLPWHLNFSSTARWETLGHFMIGFGTKTEVRKGENEKDPPVLSVFVWGEVGRALGLGHPLFASNLRCRQNPGST